MRAQLWDALESFEKWVDIRGPIPEVLVVDDHHYIRFREGDLSADGVPRYKFAVGCQTLRTEPVPIYVARMFTNPIIFQAKQLRLFSGCHGVSSMTYDNEMRLSWKEKIVVQVRGLTAIRINGVWCPELPRDPGMSNEKAMLHDHATKALAFTRRALKYPAWERPEFRLSAIGIDEYGRMICDVSKFVPAKLTGEDKLTQFTPLALKSNLFEPTRLVT